MSAEQSESIARAYFAAVARGDRAALLALFAPDIVWRVPKGAIEPYGGAHSGAEKIVDMMLGAVGTAFVPGTQRIEVTLLIARGNVVMAETRMTAQRPNGAPDYDNDYVFVFELRGGRIAEIREHVDTRYAAKVFGG
jgi:hypothetical protein